MMVNGRPSHENWAPLARIELQKAKVKRVTGAERRVANFMLTEMINRVRVEGGKEPLPVPPV